MTLESERGALDRAAEVCRKIADEYATSVDNEWDIARRCESGILALAAAEKVGESGDLLAGLERATNEGYCPRLVFDDNGHWAVADSGSQNVPAGDDPEDIEGSYFVPASCWKPTPQEAIRAYLDEIKIECPAPPPAEIKCCGEWDTLMRCKVCPHPHSTPLSPVAAPAAVPVAMVLYCPRCQFQHVDAPEPESGWTNPPHATHTCKQCKLNWRPSNTNTEGVATIPASAANHSERITNCDPARDATPAQPEGVFVPREPTEEMLKAGGHIRTPSPKFIDGIYIVGREEAGQVWKAMLSAAPSSDRKEPK